MATATPPVSFTLNMSRRINAPRDRVFEAFTKLDQLRQWWGPQGFTLPTAELDLRVGGKYRFDMQSPDGSVYVVGGTYTEINPPEKLAYTWHWEGATEEPETLVTIEFRDVDGATELLLTHSKFSTPQEQANHEEGWVGCLDRLTGLVS